MALTLGDLLKSREELKRKEEAEAGQPASMSMEQLKQLAGSVTGAAPAHTKSDAALTKIYQELKKHTAILNEIKGKKGDGGGYQVTREDRIEAGKVQDEQIKLLRQIAENTSERKEKQAEEKKKELDLPFGKLAMGLAAGIAGVIAAFQAQIKTIQLFAKALLPESWLNLIRKKTTSFLSGLSMAYDMAKVAILEQFNVARKIFTDVVDNIKVFLSGEGALPSTIRKVMEITKNVFTTLAEPFVELFKYIKRVANFTSVFAPVTDAIKSVMSWSSKFAGVVQTLAPKLLKLFYPITVIMTLWDTVKGALEGWEKDGLVGAVKGAITGLANSLVGGLLDLAKNAISWLFGVFGFDGIEKFLDSFSFQDIIKDFVEALFSPLQLLQDIIMHPIDTIKGIFDKMVSWFTDFEIPKIGFTVFGKEFSVGPWHPFRKEAEAPVESGKGAGGEQAKAAASTPAEAPAAKTSTPVVPPPTDVSGKVQAQQVAPGHVQATMSGITSDDIHNHPNYQKYYDDALKNDKFGGTQAQKEMRARKKAWLKVQGDMAREATAQPQAAPAQQQVTPAPQAVAPSVAAAQEQVITPQVVTPQVEATQEAAAALKTIAEDQQPATPQAQQPSFTDKAIAATPSIVNTLATGAVANIPALSSIPGAAAIPMIANALTAQAINAFATPTQAGKSPATNIQAMQLDAFQNRNAEGIIQLSPSTAPVTQATSVYERSGENAGAAVQQPAPPTVNVVNTPTTNVNNTTNSIVRLPSRNTDSTLQDFYKNRYAF